MPEAAEQLGRALAQIATLPSTPVLRRDEIKLQVALITPLMHFKGYGAEETKAAALRARTLIEQAEARGEAPEDPLLLFSVLYSFWVANFNGFHAGQVTELAAQFLQRAEEQRAATPHDVGAPARGRFPGNDRQSFGRAGRISIVRSGLTIPRSIGNSQRGSDRISGLPRCATAPGSVGWSDILTPRLLTPNARWPKPGRWVKEFH